jgi:murein DD-endopeptidase MepM/ murein hydrolase activator NlpD
VLAPADGTVVKVSDWQRDHWSRTSWLALAVMLVVEGTVRELTGPGRVLGNHVVIDLGDGAYALLAHLRRRSALVTAGQRVAAGQQLAACGNSGNSAEPHVHFQLMDRPGVLLAAGLPFGFDEAVPATGQVLTGSAAWTSSQRNTRTETRLTRRPAAGPRSAAAAPGCGAGAAGRAR